MVLDHFYALGTVVIVFLGETTVDAASGGHNIASKIYENYACDQVGKCSLFCRRYVDTSYYLTSGDKMRFTEP